MACKGSRLGSALPCPAGRSVPGRGGPERRRRPRPDGTGPSVRTGSVAHRDHNGRDRPPTVTSGKLKLQVAAFRASSILVVDSWRSTIVPVGRPARRSHRVDGCLDLPLPGIDVPCPGTKPLSHGTVRRRDQMTPAAQSAEGQSACNTYQSSIRAADQEDRLRSEPAVSKTAV
jgi:hypothetical protein